jgi:anti-sigma factor RsiW
MCPDPQLLSIYIDGELPSPWKEKMESHFSQCSVCREKLENLQRLHELLKKDTTEKRTIAGKNAAESAAAEHETEFIEEARTRVWQKLESRRRFKSGVGLWRRKLSIPLPAAAAAAVIIALLTALWVRDGRVKNNGFAQQTQEPVNFILAAEDELPGIIPAADISGVLQYLTSDGKDVIILRLPESRNFSRTGEPAIIRAADYPRRQH